MTGATVAWRRVNATGLLSIDTNGGDRWRVGRRVGGLIEDREKGLLPLFRAPVKTRRGPGGPRTLSAKAGEGMTRLPTRMLPLLINGGCQDGQSSDDPTFGR